MELDDIDIDWMPEPEPADVPVLPSVTQVHPDNPAEIGYPPTLPLEIALGTSPIAEVLAAYGIPDHEWERIRYDDAFVVALYNAREMLHKDGMSFKIKAKLQAEELLKTTWAIIHARETSPQVKADLIKATVRWAGYDVQETQSAGGTG